MKDMKDRRIIVLEIRMEKLIEALKDAGIFPPELDLPDLRILQVTGVHEHYPQGIKIVMESDSLPDFYRWQGYLIHYCPERAPIIVPLPTAHHPSVPPAA